MLAKVLIGVGVVVALAGLALAVLGGPEQAPLGLMVMGMGTAPTAVGLGLTLMHRYTVDGEDDPRRHQDAP